MNERTWILFGCQCHVALTPDIGWSAVVVKSINERVRITVETVAPCYPTQQDAETACEKAVATLNTLG